MANTIKVRAAAGRLYPHPSGKPEMWIGWRECAEGEEAEMVLPAGHGPRDTWAGSKHQPAGREIRIRRVDEGVTLDLSVCAPSDIRRAIAHGDLIEVVA